MNVVSEQKHHEWFLLIPTNYGLLRFGLIWSFLNIFLYFSKVRKSQVDDAAKHKKKEGPKQPRNSRGNHYMWHILLKDDIDIPYRFVCVLFILVRVRILMIWFALSVYLFRVLRSAASQVNYRPKTPTYQSYMLGFLIPTCLQSDI